MLHTLAAARGQSGLHLSEGAEEQPAGDMRGQESGLMSEARGAFQLLLPSF